MANVIDMMKKSSGDRFVCKSGDLEELKQINAEYMQVMGEPLIAFD